jgi:Gpi18-like mannosyltransferase
MHLNKNKVVILTFTLIALILIVLRISVWRFVSDDYTYFLSPWYDYFHTHGIAAFKDNFANYNTPYLFLLYILSNLPIDKLLGIKLLSILFDIVLAISVYLVVRHYKSTGILPYVSVLVCLITPAILMNSSLWGQCDSIFTSFIIFSFYALLKKRFLPAWILWGIAFAFKLQAVFFLPLLFYIWLIAPRKYLKEFLSPLSVAVVFVLSIAPALLIGRSFGSLVSVYIQQTSGGFLTLNATTMYQWIPNEYFTIFNHAGVLFTAAAVLSILCVAYYKFGRNISNVNMLKLATLLLFSITFLLPQMHERYFYIADVFSLILFFSISLKYFFVYLAAQITSFFSYSIFLFKVLPVVPMQILSLVELTIIIYLVYITFLEERKPDRAQTKQPKKQLA